MWLEACGENGWVALSRDQRIQYTPLAQETIMRAGVRLFVLIGKHPHARLARNLVNTFDRVLECIDRNEDGFIARVYLPGEEAFERSRPGRVREWLTHREWSERAGPT